MTAPRMTDAKFRRVVGLARNAAAPGTISNGLLRDEAIRARASESALLARVERLEGRMNRLAWVAQRLVSVPVRDCPWGCEPDDGHRSTCPATVAAALLSEPI